MSSVSTGPVSPPPPARRNKWRRADAARLSRPPWAVMSCGFGLITGILLWFGVLIVVRLYRRCRIAIRRP